MIEVEMSRSGHQVLKKDGRFLSSSFDPIKEAKTWVDRLAPQLENTLSVALLGLGSGYHWRELKTRFPRIKVTVIEGDAGVFEKALSIHPELTMATVAIGEEVSDLLQLTAVHALLSQPFRLFKHPSSVELQSIFYTQVESFLLARMPSSFLNNLVLRSELQNEITPDALAEIGSEVVTIKTIEKLLQLSPARAISDERTLWNILSELVV
jgi:trans-aconitate methyltransferase